MTGRHIAIPADLPFTWLAEPFALEVVPPR
jgi:hypothetical protein